MIGTKQDMAVLGSPSGLRVRRDGDRDLTFRGWLLGEGSHGTGSHIQSQCDRGTMVQVYLTTGGRLVTAVYQWTRWQGEHGATRAAAHESADAALAWLVADAGGKLGRASKEAWERACQTYPPIAAAETVEVE